MSLLMDALKRAEEAKRQGAQQQGTSGDSGLSLEARPGDQSPLPDLSSHIDAVDADLEAEASQRQTPQRSAPTADMATPPPAVVSRERESARQAFAPKTNVPVEPGKSRVFLLIGIGSLAGLAVTGYFWYQYMAVTESASRLVPSGRLAMAPAPARPIAVAPPAAAPAAPPTSPVAEVTSTAAAQAPLAVPAAEAPVVSRRAAVPVASRGVPSVRAAETRRSPPSSGGARTAAQQIAVTFGTSQLDAALSMGYSALNRGDLDAATIAYQEALRVEPRQLDALLGLSAIAAHKGEVDRAAQGYFRVLEIDPRNPSAHVGLIGLGASGDVNQRESHLRSLLSQQAVGGYEAGMLQFGLGNLYASQRRWSDAQQAFFSAHASDAGNPDYLYNLAVSLDHLQQRALALRHYQAALNAAESRPGTFDRRDLDARIAELSR